MQNFLQRISKQYDLYVRGFGTTAVWVQDQRIDRWASLRGLSILRYLALQHPRPVHREKLMDLLWPHSSARAARNNLNVAIHGLRRSLEAGGAGPHVVFKDGCYLLSPTLDVWFDVSEFEAERDRAHHHRREGAGPETAAEVRACFARMTQLYQGELFADDTAGEWLLPIRRLLEEQFAEALEVTAEEAQANGDHVTCVDTCHRLLTVDPCREPAHRLLMVAYTAQGLYHLAARQYAACVSSLQEELDVAPHPDTTALFLSLLGSRS